LFFNQGRGQLAATPDQGSVRGESAAESTWLLILPPCRRHGFNGQSAISVRENISTGFAPARGLQREDCEVLCWRRLTDLAPTRLSQKAQGVKSSIAEVELEQIRPIRKVALASGNPN
jgi:hypothetical protein